MRTPWRRPSSHHRALRNKAGREEREPSICRCACRHLQRRCSDIGTPLLEPGECVQRLCFVRCDVLGLLTYYYGSQSRFMMAGPTASARTLEFAYEFIAGAVHEGPHFLISLFSPPYMLFLVFFTL
jgi:hypothetical protein